MRSGALVASLALAATAAGCGNRTAPDLFVISRSGAGPGATLLLQVRDDGLASCNRGERRRLPDELLLDAREIARELADEAARDLVLPPGRGSQLRYRVRLEDGTVTFSDSSRGQAKAMFQAQAFTRRVAKDVCGLPR
jgi:hypothetical protein